jgi:hypothetical protein
MDLAKYPVTIVTCYFEIPSKYSTSKYDEWMRNMLLNIETPMIIYCDSKSIQKIGQLRSGFIKTTLLIQTEITDFMCYKYLEDWKRTLELDSSKDIHNIELYMIWAEKSAFLKKSVEMNPFKSYFFMWCDIGYFRNTVCHIPAEKLRHFPSLNKINQLPRNKMLLLSLLYYYTQPKIGGGMFGGFSDTIMSWYKIYYEILEEFFATNKFAGQDQVIMKEITIRYPELCNCIHAGMSDDWFFLHRILA